MLIFFLYLRSQEDGKKSGCFDFSPFSNQARTSSFTLKIIQLFQSKDENVYIKQKSDKKLSRKSLNFLSSSKCEL